MHDEIQGAIKPDEPMTNSIHATSKMVSRARLEKQLARQRGRAAAANEQVQNLLIENRSLSFRNHGLQAQLDTLNTLNKVTLPTKVLRYENYGTYAAAPDPELWPNGISAFGAMLFLSATFLLGIATGVFIHQVLG